MCEGEQSAWIATIWDQASDYANDRDYSYWEEMLIWWTVSYDNKDKKACFIPSWRNNQSKENPIPEDNEESGWSDYELQSPRLELHTLHI